MLNSNFITKVKNSCKHAPKILALPEAQDKRVLDAAYELLKDQLVSAIHFYKSAKLVESLNKDEYSRLQEFKEKIFWHDCDPNSISDLFSAGEHLAKGMIDAVVAGSVHTTADVCRAAIKTIGLSPGIRTISGAFFMHKEPVNHKPVTLLFADSAVVIEPNCEQLVDIAYAATKTWQAICPGSKPVVAFLSFSTKGSASHNLVNKVSQAAANFQQRFPKIAADGELQFDAAFDEQVGKRKCPDSKVTGKVNCYIFPDLNSGNIAYKITQRLAGFEAYGPILQGTAKPFSDLSRGASSQDIVICSCINMILSEKS